MNKYEWLLVRGAKRPLQNGWRMCEWSLPKHFKSVQMVTYEMVLAGPQR